MGKNYYEILGLTKSASEEDIRKAYRKMALKFHPDKNKEADAEEKFKAIAEAYEVLSDKQKRDAFDSFGDKGVRNGAGHFKRASADPFDLFKTFFHGSDPFNSLFGDSFGSSFHQHHHAHHLHHRPPTSLFNAHPIFRSRVFGSTIFNDLPSRNSSTTTSTCTSKGGDPIIIKKTVVSGDGIIRTEMRFRSTSENEVSKDHGEETFRRQKSEPVASKEKVDNTEAKPPEEAVKQSIPHHKNAEGESRKTININIPIQRNSQDFSQSNTLHSSRKKSASVSVEISEKKSGKENVNNQEDNKKINEKYNVKIDQNITSIGSTTENPQIKVEDCLSQECEKDSEKEREEQDNAETISEEHINDNRDSIMLIENLKTNKQADHVRKEEPVKNTGKNENILQKQQSELEGNGQQVDTKGTYSAEALKQGISQNIDADGKLSESSNPNIHNHSESKSSSQSSETKSFPPSARKNDIKQVGVASEGTNQEKNEESVDNESCDLIIAEYVNRESKTNESSSKEEDIINDVSENDSIVIANTTPITSELKQDDKEDSINKMDSETFVQKLKTNDSLLPKTQSGGKTETVNVPSWREYFGIGIK